ncbi:LysR family transcriptional regulator [Haloactinomyces albus]|uniref:DNA-binding transcriptional LysR family regulator n=1 Tax=Haloactinomyces albus TaxID=1352928 RepID=A0AAE3ZER4_9ACTN|nr:LysR family transcriptional regulator [Haloactinomyces albus]MDR7303591.1 DNA-binding transcriptional LysR family regulator [Haloactinomyces albus]
MSAEPQFTMVQLRYFAAAAQLGSMTAAAKHMVVSQSAISTAVAQLERELGVQLLIRRHAQGLALTKAGERFLQELRGFLSHAGELADVARGLGASLVGEVTVGCFQTLAPFYLPTLLTAFANEHPAVRVSVLEGQTEELQQALLSGACEIALLYDLDLDDALEREVLTVAPPYVIVPADHPLREASGVRLADLAGEPMVMLDLPHSREYFRSLALRTNVEPVVRYRTSSYETVRSLVAAGHGYAILNQQPHHDVTYDGGRIVRLALLDDVPPLPVVLARVTGIRSTVRAQAFAALCRAQLGSSEKTMD